MVMTRFLRPLSLFTPPHVTLHIIHRYPVVEVILFASFSDPQLSVRVVMGDSTPIILEAEVADHATTKLDHYLDELEVSFTFVISCSSMVKYGDFQLTVKSQRTDTSIRCSKKLSSFEGKGTATPLLCTCVTTRTLHFRKFVVIYSRYGTCTRDDEMGDPVMTSLSSEWDLGAALDAVLSNWSEKKGNVILRLEVTVIGEIVAGRKSFLSPGFAESIGVSDESVGVVDAKRGVATRPITVPGPHNQRPASVKSQSLGDEWMVVDERPPIAACQDIRNEKKEFFGTRIVKATLGRLAEAVREMSYKMALSQSDWTSYLDKRGRLVKADEMRAKVFFAGVHPDLRPTIWRHLLGVFPANISARKRLQYILKFHKKYHRLREEWKSKKDLSEFKQLRDTIMKDVRRTDRKHPFYDVNDGHPRIRKLFNILMTYAVNNQDVSYAQGMSDLASPFAVLYEEEADSYMCFSQLMKRMKHHFLLDSPAIRQKFSNLRQLIKCVDPLFYDYLKENGADDLLFCYRWLLLDMKREFGLTNALKVLEVTWSVIPDVPGPGDEEYKPSLFDDIVSSGSIAKESGVFFEDDKKVESEQVSGEEEGSEGEDEMSAIDEELRSVMPSGLNQDWEPLPAKTVPEGNADLTNTILASDCHSSNLVSSTSTVEAGKQSSSATFSESPSNAFSESSQCSLEGLKSFPIDPCVCGAGNPFSLIASLSLLLQQRNYIMDNQLDYTEIAVRYDRLSKSQNVNKFLARSRALFLNYLKQSDSSNDCAMFSAICRVELDL